MRHLKPDSTVNQSNDITHVTEGCSCHDCVQFGLSQHPGVSVDTERLELTAKSYGAIPLKPRYSRYEVYRASLALTIKSA